MADKHHHVSQFHLKQFVDPCSESTHDPWLWVAGISTNSIKRRAPKNIAWSRGMFDGPGGFADEAVSLEKHLGSKVEPAAARALWSFCHTSRGKRKDLPSDLMQYVAWAAARSLRMQELFQQWVDEDIPRDVRLAEPPPDWLTNASERSRTYRMEHARDGIRENVPSSEVNNLLTQGWKLQLGRDALLEFVHIQASYFGECFFPRLRWIVLEPPTGKSFVIGDRPVVWGFRDSLSKKPSALRHPDVQLFAPLSRSVALFAHHADASPPSFVQPDWINYVIATAATRWIAGSNETVVADALAARKVSHNQRLQ